MTDEGWRGGKDGGMEGGNNRFIDEYKAKQGSILFLEDQAQPYLWILSRGNQKKFRKF
jgi:hypothetical protein